MLIIPIIGKTSLRNPPVVTILLILVNVFVYFGFQLGDHAASMAAQKYYLESGLVDIELPRYRAFTEGRAFANADIEAVAELSEEASTAMLVEAIRDGRFQAALDNDAIITSDDPAHAKWKPLRAEFLAKYESSVTVRWGFRPIHHRPATWFTYMFLHGGIGHLIGNMIFLWLVGCILEYGAGRLSYIVIYVLGGVAAVGLFFIVERHSAIPLVGASGSIAALMGALAVLFGRERIHIFFSVGFYFNNFRILAIYLLPLWVGNELFQLFFGGVSQVAYIAHVGGLLGGAAIAAVHKRFWKDVDTEVLGEETEDTASPILEEAMTHMENLEFGRARRLLAALQQESPDNPEVLKLLFGIDRHYPERPVIHTTAAAYLKHLAGNLDQRGALLQAYDRYIAAVKTPRLPPELLLAVCRALTAGDRPADAEHILAVLHKQRSDMPGLPAAWRRLADVWERREASDRAARCRKILLRHFPTSPEAAEIRPAVD